MQRRFSTPALDAWRSELRDGKRSPEIFDPLWRAACAEAYALEFAAWPAIAEGFRRDARRIVFDALKQRGAA